jgi:CheY-like chemotaxis protein
MALKVLVVDDDETNGLILQRLLEREGYAVVRAYNGQQAVERFQAERPDLVLMDVMMPVMDGYTATQHIKTLDPERFTPVIFLTAIQDEVALARCVETGGDDFLTKPYNHLILKAKIRAMLRIGELHATVREQNAQLSVHHERLLNEQRVAEKVFDGVVRGGGAHQAGVRCLLSPTSIFNGDLFLTAFRSTGELHVLAGDFTGHGLSAAVGAVPVSDIFHTMTSNGCSIGEIAETINRKLKQILPANIFCAACLLAIDALEGKLTVWNGGFPDVLIVDGGNHIDRRVRSTHLPLGILGAAEFDRSVAILPVAAGERIYLCSDGVIDAPIAAGRRMGVEGYEACFSAPIPPEQQFDWIVGCLRELSLDEPRDDVTLIEITVDRNLICPDRRADAGGRQRAAAEWALQLDLRAQALPGFDPVPFMLRAIGEIQGLLRHKEVLYTIVSELYNNALDHGVLKLDSAIKSGPAGFAAYYAEREARLAGLNGGFVRLGLRHVPTPQGGRLTIEIEDSGAGFEYLKIGAPSETETRSSGRGIPLLRKLCERLEFLGQGNHAVATFSWTA